MLIMGFFELLGLMFCSFLGQKHPKISPMSDSVTSSFTKVGDKDTTEESKKNNPTTKSTSLGEVVELKLGFQILQDRPPGSLKMELLRAPIQGPKQMGN